MQYDEYLKSSHWHTVRDRARQRDDYKCRLCGISGQLEVHHNNYDCLGNESSSDVVTLCADCHARHHDKQPDHQAHAGAVCPDCGAELVLRIEIVKALDK